MKPEQFAAQEMTKIKVEPIHLGRASDEGRMTRGEACLIMASDKNRNDICLERTGRMVIGDGRRTARRKGCKLEQPRYKPDRTVACGLSVGTALTPFLAQCRQCPLIQSRFRQECTGRAVQIIGLACGK